MNFLARSDAGQAGLLCRAAGLAAIGKKKRAAVLPWEDWNFCDIGATNVKETRLGEPVGRASTHWASPYSLGEPSNEVGASHQTRLGRAIKRGWGEPSNEVGRASAKGPLGEPVLRGRWASQY